MQDEDDEESSANKSKPSFKPHLRSQTMASPNEGIQREYDLSCEVLKLNRLSIIEVDIGKLEHQIALYNREYKELLAKLNSDESADPIAKHRIRTELDMLSSQIHRNSETLIELKHKEQDLMKISL